MHKVFISQPMTGLSKEEILDTRLEAIEFVRQTLVENNFCCDDEIEIIDSYIEENQDKTDTTENLIYMLGTSIQLLSEAEIVYFCEGWENSRGCKVEHLVAEEYGLKFLSTKKSNKVVNISDTYIK